jgi:hypothetical protein
MRALILPLVFTAACNQASRSENFSCWFGSVCEDYGSDLDAHKHDCKQLAGEWEKHACPKENLVGTCMTEKHQPRMYYGGAQNAFTADTASASCEHEFHGTWTAATP